MTGYSIGPTHSWLQSPTEPLSFVALGAVVLNYHRFAVMAIRHWMSHTLASKTLHGVNWSSLVWWPGSSGMSWLMYEALLLCLVSSSF